MSITITYRGRLADLSRIEDFEDRLINFALEFGGQAEIWRSRSDTAPQRIVRGVILNLAPGLESTSLLLSPEGWLIKLTDTEDAEAGRLTEPPWCCTNTHLGPIEGHVALVEMFTQLQREFMPDLELSDEGGYHPTHDLARLIQQRSLLQGESDAPGHGLSREAAEDPLILARHIERVAERVRRILKRPAEHPPITFPDADVPGGLLDADATEAVWDEMFKHNRRQQERMQRAIEERLARGEDDDDAYENALGDLGLEPPDEEEDAWPYDESWTAEGDEIPDDAFVAEQADSADDVMEEIRADRHPLLQRAMDLLTRLHDVFGEIDASFEPARRTLFQGAGDVMGGLAQALARHEDELDLDDYGLRVVQYKRALRGAAFACGALLALRPVSSREMYDELHRAFQEMQHRIFHELSELRAKRRSED